MAKLTRTGITAMLNFFTGRDLDPTVAGNTPRTTTLMLTSSTTASVSGAPSSDPDQATTDQWLAKELDPELGVGYTTRIRLDNATQAITWPGSGVGASIGEVTAPLADFTATVATNSNLYGFAILIGANAATVGSGSTASGTLVLGYADFDGAPIALTAAQTLRVVANSIQFRAS